MADEKPRGEKDIRIWKFIVTYVLLMGLFLLLIGLEPVKKILDINGVYTEMIIYLTAWILEPFNIVQGISGSVINVKGLTMDVRFGCNGLEAFLIYTVAILAFPTKVKKKIVGIVGGFFVLQILNVLRIAGLGLSGVYLKKYFEYLHIYVAQGIMIAVALVLFLFWLNYATGKSD